MRDNANWAETEIHGAASSLLTAMALRQRQHLCLLGASAEQPPEGEGNEEEREHAAAYGREKQVVQRKEVSSSYTVDGEEASW